MLKPIGQRLAGAVSFQSSRTPWSGFEPTIYARGTSGFSKPQHLHAPFRGLERSKQANHDMAFWRGKQDVLRHSYGTHRMAIVRNAHQVAEEMGNSVVMVRRHYDCGARTVKGDCMVGNNAKGTGQRVANEGGCLAQILRLRRLLCFLH